MHPSFLLSRMSCVRALCSAGIACIAPAAMAAGPSGQIGPAGPVGVQGAAQVQGTATTVIENPGSGTNRIEVTGNTAQNVQVQCADGSRKKTAPQAAGSSVNSVNIDGRALAGKTVVVTGRNSRDVRATADCQDGAAAPTTNVNSVTIR